MKFVSDIVNTYKLTFAGLLAVYLMEFDFEGKHYSYHGRKLENAVMRLIPTLPRKASPAELAVLAAARRDWKKLRTNLRGNKNASISRP
jgi:hypothetical protein